MKKTAERIKNGEKFKIVWPNGEIADGMPASSDGWTVQSWNDRLQSWESISIVHTNILFEVNK